MRKTKDDRVKITTHHFRISIEEEEDDEDNKEAEDQTIREMDRKISITIETDSNVTIGGQESGIKNFSFDQEESSFSINDQLPEKILNKNVEDNWNERERQRTSDFQFGTSIDSDSSEDRNDDQKRRKMDELADENFSDDSGRSRKQLEKMQSDSLESETRSLATFTEVSNENRGIFDSSNEIPPPSTSFEQKGNFGPVYSTIKYSIEGRSYENANSINKLDHVGSISTASYLPFVEISNPVTGSTIKRHGSLSTYETRLSSMNSPVERKRTQSTNEKMLQHSKKALPRSSERRQSIITTPEIQETSALDHPIVSSEVSPLLVRRCYKFMPTIPPHSSSLEIGENSLETRDIVTNKSGTRNTESSFTFNVDPNSKDASKSSKIEELACPSIPRVSPLLLRRYYKIMSTRSSSLEEISRKNHQEEDQDTKEPITNNQSIKNSEEANQSNAAQRRSTLPTLNIDLNSKSVSNSPNYQDGQLSVLSGTSVNPIRRSSIASAAICSSLAPSLVSASQGIPNCLLPISDEKEVSNVSTNIGDHGRSGIRLKLPFLKIHIPVQQPATSSWSASKEDVGHHYSHHHHHHHHHHHVFPHFHVPTFMFTATATDGTESGRKFNFGIRRHSQMVS